MSSDATPDSLTRRRLLHGAGIALAAALGGYGAQTAFAALFVLLVESGLYG